VLFRSDVQNDEHLWSEDYDRKFENVFTLQKEIAQKVASSLQVTIPSKESTELGKKPTQSMEAYILYLKGSSYLHRATLESVKRAIDYFEQAIEKDPNYAQAYAAIASTYSTFGFSELLPTNEAFSKAEGFARKAMELDSSIPESHIAIGWVLFQKWDFQGVEIEFKRAVELNPNLVDGHIELAALYLELGKFEEAAVESRRALELDPFSVSTCAWAGGVLGSAHYFDEAIEVLRNAIELDPNGAQSHNTLGTSYVMKGRIEEGIAEIKTAIEISKGEMANWKSDLAWAYAKMGNMEEVRNILAELLKTNEQSHKSETEIAAVYVSLGEKDKAFEWLEKAYDRHAGYLLGLNYDSSFDDIRTDPRFQALRKKIGFPD
jgi:adenylate cyclase